MKNREISWTNIYSLQLLPAVVLWVLTPLLEARTTIVASMAVGVVWIVVSIFLSKLYKGCGTIGWIVGWALAVSGVLWLGLALLHLPFVPMVLFQAPFMALLTYLFEQRNIQPPFCQQCVIKRGGIWERNLLGDYTRLEAYNIIRILLFGALIVAVVAWALFLWGIDTQSRLGRYFYLFFPAALCVALILFETIRRWLLEMAIHPSGKREKLAMNGEEGMEHVFSTIRIMVIAQEKIFLVERTDKADKEEIWGNGAGLDIPIHHSYIDYCLNQLSRPLVYGRRDCPAQPEAPAPPPLPGVLCPPLHRGQCRPHLPHERRATIPHPGLQTRLYAASPARTEYRVRRPHLALREPPQRRPAAGPHRPLVPKTVTKTSLFNLLRCLT